MERILENLVNDRGENSPSNMEESTAPSVESANSAQMTTSSTSTRLDTEVPEEKEVSSTVEEEICTVEYENQCNTVIDQVSIRARLKRSARFLAGVRGGVRDRVQQCHSH